MLKSTSQPRGRPFQKGQSGNPRGKSLPALLVAALNQKVYVTIDGKRRKITKREAIMPSAPASAASCKPASPPRGARAPLEAVRWPVEEGETLPSGELHRGFMQNKVSAEGSFFNVRRATSATLWTRAAAGLEILTGLGLIVAPSLLARLLFGTDLNAAGEATGRISGFVMLCLAVGCWPRAGESGRHQALFPLLALSWLAAVFLVVTGLIGANIGLLLWPAAALHLILAVLLTWKWRAAPAS